MKNIVVFASGSGSNAVSIIQYFQNNENARVKAVFVNKENAPIIAKAKALNVEVFQFNREDFYQTDKVIKALQERKADCIALAGFMWLIPKNFVQSFKNKIVNIHPALLPNYGGKGMYGMHVHRAVFQNQEKKSGITIHLVNEVYDDGEILHQEEVDITTCQSPEEIASKVLKVEHQFYAPTIEKFLLG